MREKIKPKRITPEEFVKRSHLNVRYKIAKLEANFIEKVANAAPTEFMGLLEDHFLERFRVWALAAAPFAKSPTSIDVHPDYFKALTAAKERVLFDLSYETGSLPTDLQEGLRTRVALRLAARCNDYWAEAGMILLNADPGPYIVGADSLLDPWATGQSMQTTVVPATITHGPRIDYATAIKVAQIVQEIAPDGKWRPNLDDILVALDDAAIPTPKTWRPKHGYRNWYAAVTDTVTRGRHMAIEAIKHHLKRAKEMPTETIP